MNYSFGFLKIPKDFTVKQLNSAIKLISAQYNVKIGIAQIKELNTTFYKLKLKSNEKTNKVKTWFGEYADLVIDHDLKIYDRNSPKN